MINSGISLKDIAFIAGFYEGEGYCARIGKSFTVSINQNDKEILERINHLIGGKIYGPYKGPIGNCYYNWKLSEERAIGFMFTIFSFLSKSRRKQFRLALEGKESNREYEKISNFDVMLREDKIVKEREINKFWRSIKSNE